MRHNEGMAFRVLVIGAPGFYAYARLRDALDLALANRLPDVQLITAGGPGVPALAACYARSRGLPLEVALPDFNRYPANAIEKRNSQLVADADAVVVAGEDLDLGTYKLVQRVKAKGGRVLVVRKKKSEVVGVEALESARRGLPD
jgi:hypothetical protein